MCAVGWGCWGGANVELPDPDKGYGVGAPAAAAVDIVDVDVDGCWFVAHVANDGQGRQKERVGGSEEEGVPVTIAGLKIKHY